MFGVDIFLKAEKGKKKKIPLILSLFSWLMDFYVIIFESLFYYHKRSMEHFKGGKKHYF